MAEERGALSSGGGGLERRDVETKIKNRSITDRFKKSLIELFHERTAITH